MSRMDHSFTTSASVFSKAKILADSSLIAQFQIRKKNQRPDFQTGKERNRKRINTQYAFRTRRQRKKYGQRRGLGPKEVP